MPKAIAPKAPWVLVWESPQAIVVPGWVMPCSGPTMWTMPCLPVLRSKKVMPNSRQFRRSSLIIASASGSGKGSANRSVGTMWSTVAKVRCGIGDLEAEVAQHPEGLRAGHLVDQVGADQELGLAVGQFADRVGGPDFFKEGRGHGGGGRRRSVRRQHNMELPGAGNTCLALGDASEVSISLRTAPPRLFPRGRPSAAFPARRREPGGRAAGAQPADRPVRGRPGPASVRPLEPPGRADARPAAPWPSRSNPSCAPSRPCRPRSGRSPTARSGRCGSPSPGSRWPRCSRRSCGSFTAGIAAIRLELNESPTSAQLAALQAGEISCGFFHPDAPAPGLQTRLLLKERNGVLLPSDHPLAGRGRPAAARTGRHARSCFSRAATIRASTTGRSPPSPPPGSAPASPRRSGRGPTRSAWCGPAWARPSWRSPSPSCFRPMSSTGRCRGPAPESRLVVGWKTGAEADPALAAFLAVVLRHRAAD